MTDPSIRQQALFAWLDERCLRASLAMAERAEEALLGWYGHELDLLLLNHNVDQLAVVSFAPNQAHIERVFEPLVKQGKASYIRPDAIIERGQLTRAQLVIPTKST